MSEQPRRTLTRAHFKEGTVRLRSPGRYILAESIEFAPIRAPCAADGLAQSRGWLAALTIESDDVFLDLSGFSIAQSEEHATVQRFFALVCVGSHMFADAHSGPFSMGPAGDRAPANVTICNGTLGLTSHFGVYAPRSNGLFICDVRFQDWEVSAISVNQARGVVLRRCLIEKCRARMDLGPNFSHLQHVTFDLRALVNTTHPDTLELELADGDRVSAHDILAQCEGALARIGENAARGRPALAGLDEDWRTVLEETSTLINGSTYGCAVNGTESMVRALVEEDDAGSERPLARARVPDLEATDVEIRGVKSHAASVLAFQDEDGQSVVSASGQAPSITLTPERCCRLSPLLFAQLFVMKHQVGRARCPSALIQWCLSGDRTRGASTIADLLSRTGCRLLEKQDAMLHTHKGCIGFLCRHLVGVNLTRVTISNVSQTARPSVRREALAREEETHVTPASACGLALVSSSRVRLDDVDVEKVRSAFGKAAALAVLGSCTDLTCRALRARAIRSWAGAGGDAARGNTPVLVDARAQQPQPWTRA